MNNDRRKALRKLAEEASRLIGKLEDLKSELETLRDDEQEYFDNMPESLQGSERGQTAEAAVSSMEEAIESLTTLIDDDLVGKIEAAAD